MGPFAIIALGGAAYYIYEKQKNPAWSPFTQLLSTPVDKVVALEKVKVTSVPTPSPTVGLDPHMTTDQVKQVNQTLTLETDPKKIAAQALALSAIGHENSSMALAAKANAVGEAKATGAHDVDIHLKQIEAARMSPFEHVPVPIDAPMTACEAQVLLNVLVSRQGHFDVEGIPVPLAITNVFDADTSHMIRVFQAEMHLPATGTMDVETAKVLRVAALGSGSGPSHAVGAGWYDERGRWHHHHHHHHRPVVEEVIVPEVIEGVVQGVGWGPAATGSGGPVATGFYGHGFHHPWAGENFGGWTQPWQHNYHPHHRHHGWAGWPWHHHHGWHGFVGRDERERRHEGRFGREHEFGRGREHEFGRGREHFGRERFGRERFGREPVQMMEEVQMPMPMPMHHRHHHHRLTEQQLFEQQEQQRLWELQHHPHHHHHHRHHQQMQMQMQQAMQPMQPQDGMGAEEAAAPAGMPIGGGGGAAAMAAPAIEPDHTPDVAADAETATKGWWLPDQPGSYGHDPYGLYGYDPGFGYEPGSLGRDPYWGSNSGFGGYGSIGWGGPGGLGGYGSWGSFGGWGHGL